jgi:hypothetical protein
MAVKLNNRAFHHAKELVSNGRVVKDERDNWSEHRPSADQENSYLEKHGWDEYAKWYLGVDDEMGEETKGRYKFPYGDFEKVHRCGVISAESRAAQQDYDDIDKAVAHLHGMIDGSEH